MVYQQDNPATAVPQVFLVKSQRPDGWTEVLLPVRPNGSTGWVHASEITLTPNPCRIAVSLGADTITVTNARDVIYTGPGGGGGTRDADADRQLLPGTCSSRRPIRAGRTARTRTGCRATRRRCHLRRW